MTIQEVLSTGKRFKRKGLGDWVDPNFSTLLMSKGDLLAGDWEIEIERLPPMNADDLIKALVAVGVKPGDAASAVAKLKGGK